ncbi:MAG: carbon starvation protein A, partial [Candidatus Omnitrophica bacterium]|nr:carbon starvation protein A [Candidatus Omnitrophota bacterium]
MSAIIPLLVLSSLLAAYFFYGRFINKILGIDPNRETPACKNEDGVDYVPAKNWFILFGHHFASIAGAAPIVGPVVAVALWGWGPSILWIVLGSVFFGGI